MFTTEPRIQMHFLNDVISLYEKAERLAVLVESTPNLS